MTFAQKCKPKEYMEVITVESKVFKDIMGKLNDIAGYVRRFSEIDTEAWVDNYDVCKYLHVSDRTLQRLRSDGLLNYSIIKGKTYYKMSEIWRMMNEHLIKSDPKNFQDLLDNYTRHAVKTGNIGQD
jgi:hypothetical protein